MVFSYQRFGTGSREAGHGTRFLLLSLQVGWLGRIGVTGELGSGLAKS